MSMLNAHTATRSFRELQYDLQVFLEGLDDIAPVGSPHGISLVELKWADGSIDLVPSTEFITGLVYHLFSQLTIGDKATLTPVETTLPTGKHLLDLHLNGAGLQAHFVNFGDGTESITINGGSITTLKADTLNLATGVTIGDMQIQGTTHADYCSVENTINVTGTLNLSDSSIFKVFHAEKVHLEGLVRFVNPNIPRVRMSSYDSLGWESSNPVMGFYVIRHILNYSDTYDASLQSDMRSHRANIRTQIPIPRIPEGSSGGDIVYDYVFTSNTMIPSRMTDPVDGGSSAGLMTLYPLKSTSVVSSYGTLYLKIQVPDGNDYLMHINNPTESSIRVCNAWMFKENNVRHTTPLNIFGGVDASNVFNMNEDEAAGTIIPLHYITIPAYSCIDFLFKHEIVGGNYCAYMMPTVNLDSN